jgi:surface antigen
MTKIGNGSLDVSPVAEATLMRFVDGDLPPREHAFVAELIAAHPDVLGSIRAYRFTKEELPGAYQAAMDVPAELISRWLPGARVGRPAGPSARPRFARRRLTALALAASLAVLLAGAAGWHLREATHPDVAGLLGVAPPALQRALENTPTGKIGELAGSLSVTPTSTFASRERHWCRKYALKADQRERVIGLACRQEDGWQILMQAASAHTTPSGGNVYAPAGEGEGDPVAAYASEINDGTPLSQEDEARLINERWRRKP